ncbi:hypothetical protein [Sphaerisporangium corydalis]|uniref:Uncharacterized protein n=1 Tax=Sphaerisporangium corydalis TaxID=1441875 RepID=A0ABV9EMQ4_9ACTN|nr:hypothetical protein [Sphaerisporangium corydalis]
MEVAPPLARALTMSSALWLRTSAALVEPFRPHDGVFGVPDFASLIGHRSGSFRLSLPGVREQRTVVPDFGQMSGESACLSMTVPAQG